jgi:hypothetical protein
MIETTASARGLQTEIWAQYLQKKYERAHVLSSDHPPEVQSERVHITSNCVLTVLNVSFCKFSCVLWGYKFM